MATSQCPFGSSPRSCNDALRRRRRRRPALLSAFAAQAAILVSSILVSSPAMIALVGATPISSDDGPSYPASTYPSSFAANQRAGQQLLGSHYYSSEAQSADSTLDSHVQYTPAQPPPSSSRQATLPSRNNHAAASIDDVDDDLPHHLHDPPALHWQHARRYDDDSTASGDLDVSTMTQDLELNADPSPVLSEAIKRATQSAHRYSLPSSYPSTIASSWSRPERSVWFQQKAIIITSIFLAIFIVLFIGAAVFLRERKFDDELADLDDEEALQRIEERMTMGRFSEPVEKGSDSPGGGGKFKRRLRLGRKRSEKDGSNPDSSDPSSASSSAVKRKRHLVSRWTRGSLRDSNDTMRAVSDTASIRSGRSARRAALGDPRTPQESVEITYDSEGAEVPRTHRESTGASSGSTGDDVNRPRSPPPPHPDDTGRPQESSSEVRSSSNTDAQRNRASDSDASVRSPRRVLLDDSDFHAADAAETQHNDMRHMPPAYIPSGSGGHSQSTYDGAVVAEAIARGDAKHGVPPPEERDPTVSHEVITAALSRAPARSSDAYESPTGPVAAHIATDDKAVLGALSAAASMPSAPAVDRELSAPAYGAGEGSAAGGSSNIAGAPGAVSAGPSAPDLEVDGDGFEVAPAAEIASGSTLETAFADEKGASKGKGKQIQSGSVLPAPPTAVETAFSPFDQPYRSSGPPGTNPATSPPSGRVSPPLGRKATSDAPSGPKSLRKSEKQKEAEQEQHLAQLVASRPDGMDVPQYERLDGDAVHGPSAPPLLAEADEEEHRAAVEEVTGRDHGVADHLPAYEQRRSSTVTAVSAAAAAAATTTTPESEVGRLGRAMEGNQSSASAPPAPTAPFAPSAPPPTDTE
ncbi:hypothetical protein EX895_003072 [Sporisorium graminicola]|uniref:Uncharacterized protein n=1 Tax=Sporisorium graminicola TaxID=280036 RepID=A0A4U7KUZ3_9BASI|nr:hypothetical protein EX895_003072 [Sporisorium graminicola]TKY87976.1 hypothetical protein EX895_003072 [Sporisorium graminicola]